VVQAAVGIDGGYPEFLELAKKGGDRVKWKLLMREKSFPIKCHKFKLLS
jgi:hypothetical protein